MRFDREMPDEASPFKLFFFIVEIVKKVPSDIFIERAIFWWSDSPVHILLHKQS